MNTYVLFHELAENNNLQFIETTDGMNGYPQNLKPALIGFETFEEAKEFASEHGLETWIFHKRDGWQLWERKTLAYVSFHNSADDYGDNYNMFESDDKKDYYENEVKPRLENFSDLNDLKKFVEKQEEIMDELERCDDGEAVITYCGEYYETIKVRSMEFYHDTHSYVIGVM
jgi:hypothetical protein